jgi:hypothetical protein
MQGNATVIELLNDVLTAELTAINQYFVDAKMFDNWGLERLGKHFYDESIGEMKDADHLIERILFLDGVPNLQRLGTVKVGETAPEKLAAALELERVQRAGRPRHPRAARGHPRRRGGTRRLARVPARGDPPGRARELPRPADPLLTRRPGED